jgi:hypothetical protein
MGLIDRYLEIKKNVEGEDLNLLVTSSIIIANKFENQNGDFLEDTIIVYFKKRGECCVTYYCIFLSLNIF